MYTYIYTHKHIYTHMYTHTHTLVIIIIYTDSVSLENPNTCSRQKEVRWLENQVQFTFTPCHSNILSGLQFTKKNASVHPKTLTSIHFVLNVFSADFWNFVAGTP